MSEEITPEDTTTPENADAYFERGKEYYAKNEYELAIADFEMALKLNPDCNISRDLIKMAKASKTHAKLRKLDIKLKGKWYSILAGKPTSIPNRRIYLLSARDEEYDYSLWLIEIDDDNEEIIHSWPYECPDAEKLELLKELLEEFIATAFD
ncbi:MAG: tetratricopeptide repeat protein [Treponema sp.]|jgi:tetratricopeptide (TPR) repeat protein|nr:tetratricopeptide repeat protein [Treponema sp.]